MYLNPGSDGFAAAVSNEYVNKTGLIALINHTINTKLKLTCVRRKHTNPVAEAASRGIWIPC